MGGFTFEPRTVRCYMQTVTSGGWHCFTFWKNTESCGERLQIISFLYLSTQKQKHDSWVSYQPLTCTVQWLFAVTALYCWGGGTAKSTCRSSTVPNLIFGTHMVAHNSLSLHFQGNLTHSPGLHEYQAWAQCTDILVGQTHNKRKKYTNGICTKYVCNRNLRRSELILVPTPPCIWGFRTLPSSLHPHKKRVTVRGLRCYNPDVYSPVTHTTK